MALTAEDEVGYMLTRYQMKKSEAIYNESVWTSLWLRICAKANFHDVLQICC
jgi:hypothetical protein